MSDMVLHIGRAAIGGDSGSRWEVPLKAVSNGDGTYSLAVSADGGINETDVADIKALLIDIKAELVTLNAITSVEVDIL